MISLTNNSATKLPQHMISTFDPNKSSIMQNHLSHKSKVSTLKNQFVSQKALEKKMLQKQIEIYKKQIIQTQK